MAVDKQTIEAEITNVGDPFTTDYGRRQKIKLKKDGKEIQALYCGDQELNWRTHKNKSYQFVLWKSGRGWCCDLPKNSDPFTEASPASPSGNGKEDMVRIRSMAAAYAKDLCCAGKIPTNQMKANAITFTAFIVSGRWAEESPEEEVPNDEPPWES